MCFLSEIRLSSLFNVFFITLCLLRCPFVHFGALHPVLGCLLCCRCFLLCECLFLHHLLVVGSLLSVISLPRIAPLYALAVIPLCLALSDTFTPSLLVLLLSDCCLVSCWPSSRPVAISKLSSEPVWSAVSEASLASSSSQFSASPTYARLSVLSSKSNSASPISLVCTVSMKCFSSSTPSVMLSSMPLAPFLPRSSEKKASTALSATFKWLSGTCFPSAAIVSSSSIAGLCSASLYFELPFLFVNSCVSAAFLSFTVSSQATRSPRVEKAVLKCLMVYG